MQLRGIYAPATTPFDPVTGDADPVALRANLRAWLAHPLAGIVLFGSTGEGPLLDEEERRQLLAAARDVIPDGRLLLAGTGAESTRATIRVTRAAAEEGADAVLVQPPGYFRPLLTPEALRDHYQAVADASPVPVLLYQVPPRFAGAELPAGLVGELMKHDNIVGIKDSSGDLRTLGALVEAVGSRGAVLAGSGAVVYGALEIGAAGGVLAISLLAPAECAALCGAHAAGRLAEAGRLQERLAPLHRAIVGELGVPGVKAALEELGLYGGGPRAPLKPLRAPDRESVRAALHGAGLQASGLAPPRGAA